MSGEVATLGSLRSVLQVAIVTYGVLFVLVGVLTAVGYGKIPADRYLKTIERTEQWKDAITGWHETWGVVEFWLAVLGLAYLSYRHNRKNARHALQKAVDREMKRLMVARDAGEFKELAPDELMTRTRREILNFTIVLLILASTSPAFASERPGVTSLPIPNCLLQQNPLSYEPGLGDNPASDVREMKDKLRQLGNTGVEVFYNGREVLIDNLAYSPDCTGEGKVKRQIFSEDLLNRAFMRKASDSGAASTNLTWDFDGESIGLRGYRYVTFLQAFGGTPILGVSATVKFNEADVADKIVARPLTRQQYKQLIASEFDSLINQAQAERDALRFAKEHPELRSEITEPDFEPSVHLTKEFLIYRNNEFKRVYLLLILIGRKSSTPELGILNHYLKLLVDRKTSDIFPLEEPEPKGVTKYVPVKVGSIASNLWIDCENGQCQTTYSRADIPVGQPTTLGMGKTPIIVYKAEGTNIDNPSTVIPAFSESGSPHTAAEPATTLLYWLQRISYFFEGLKSCGYTGDCQAPQPIVAELWETDLNGAIAQWNPRTKRLQFGKSANLQSSATDPVIIAHEYAHALIDHMNPSLRIDFFGKRCNGDPGEQYGALMESVADTVGTLVIISILGNKNDMIQYGAPVYKVGLNSLGKRYRDMVNPTKGGDPNHKIGMDFDKRSFEAPGLLLDSMRRNNYPQPDHIKNMIGVSCEGSGAGELIPYVNSGILNKAAHLIIEQELRINPVNNIDRFKNLLKKEEKLWPRTLVASYLGAMRELFLSCNETKCRTFNRFAFQLFRYAEFHELAALYGSSFDKVGIFSQRFDED